MQVKNKTRLKEKDICLEEELLRANRRAAGDAGEITIPKMSQLLMKPCLRL